LARFFFVTRPRSDQHVRRALAHTDSILADLPHLDSPAPYMELDTRLLRADLFARATQWTTP
jgi:hypothetical protein